MTAAFNAKILDPRQIYDLRPDVLDENGCMRILPATFWATTKVEERALFGVRTGLYSFPTLELVARLQEIIADRSAIEVGAGSGVLAAALGIPATDNFQQRMPQYRMIYERIEQKIVPYGANVIEMNANHAVRHFKPDVVLGCWVTHKFDLKCPDRGGNEIGLDELDILHHCAAYVVVGNEEVHQHKPIWACQHTVEYPPFVFSRAFNGSRDFIAVFQGLRREPE